MGGNGGHGKASAPKQTIAIMTKPNPSQNGPSIPGSRTRRPRKYSRNPAKLDSINKDSAATV